MQFATAPAQIKLTIPGSPDFCPLLPTGQRFELQDLVIQQDTTEALLYVRQDSLITSRFPGFEKKLLTMLPELLDNVACQNGCSHHFKTEMLATEMGHLFEHIWLEVLCCEAMMSRRDMQEVSYQGETLWNWQEEPVGFFHIRLNAGIEDRELIERSAWISSLILAKCLDD